MAEVVEYSLVVLASALFVAGSVATYGSYDSFVSGLQLRSASSTIGRLAAEAIATGTSSASVDMPASTIQCGGGVLSVSSGGESEVQTLGAGCNFNVTVQGGVHTLLFSFSSSRLTMAVS